MEIFTSFRYIVAAADSAAAHITGVSLGWAAYAAIALFIFCYALIALEHKAKLDKSGLALLAGSGIWIIISLATADRSGISDAILHESQDIFSIVVFLMAAMTIVETLLHYGLFDWIQQKITEKKLSAAQLFWTLGIITFFLSSVLDNLTTTLIMIQIGRKIYTHKQAFLIYVAAVVIAANAGGAFSPLGDVTTIILWLAGKFSALEVIKTGFLPALAIFVIPHYLLSRKIKTHEEVEKAHKIAKADVIRPQWGVVAVCLASFSLPVAANLLGLPPFMGLLTGLAVVWIVADYVNRDAEHGSDAKIISLIQKTDIATLKFFIGILLAVGGLGHLGVLDKLSGTLFGQEATASSIIIGSTVLGLFSAILDNVPLVAAALNVFPDSVTPSQWVLLALTAGTGGSLLIIGSAAGVAAMGQVPELSFGKYLKIATFPAFLGFVAGVGVWLLQYNLL